MTKINTVLLTVATLCIYTLYTGSKYYYYYIQTIAKWLGCWAQEHEAMG